MTDPKQPDQEHSETDPSMTEEALALPAKTGESPGDGEEEEGPAIPPALPLMPLRNMVLFPDMILPLVIQNERDTALVDAVLLENRMMGLVPQLSGEEDAPVRADLHGTGCAGLILKMLKFPDKTTRLLVQGLARIRIGKYLQNDPFFKSKVTVLEDRDPAERGSKESRARFAALFRTLRSRFEEFINLVPNFPEEIKVASMNITAPGRFADLVATNINLSAAERCRILDATDLGARLEALAVLLEREMQVVQLGQKIQSDVQEKVGQGQREFFLREQLKSIRKELGETDDQQQELVELRTALDEAGLPAEAKREAERELKRLENMPTSSAEYTVSRTYLDWLATLPWSRTTADILDVGRARTLMDREHYGLDKIKERIVEYLAVKKINPEGRSPILCFVGPPGVGKTSLGRSIAEAMGRSFVRISLGGVRDEAEIRGHRRTYIGALPGRVIQGLRKADSRNPVFMMDEVDKLASDFRGDPAAALLEVLDPEQNNAFSDHYLDVPFDLSSVMFITTANQADPIPPALQDRMELLRLPGYAEEEKIEIAQRHLAKKLLAQHGLTRKQVRFTKTGIRRIIADYTREAGLRNLERAMARIYRKVAVRVAEGKRKTVVVNTKTVADLLGPPEHHAEVANRVKTPGVAVGLAWTATGGDVLFIEATEMPGKGNLILTGHLGDVMKESARAALSWIRSHADTLGLQNPAERFGKSDFHVHFPEGAIPKDGPSAGITIAAALISLVTGTRLPPKLAMTGEITLRGRVLPVGGIKEKMLAARRSGIREVLLPKPNESDLLELPKELKGDLTFHPVESMDQVLALAFPGLAPEGRKPKPRRRAKGRRRAKR